VKNPIRIGIIGLGGFAGSHHNAVARLEERGHAKLVCTCDPRVEFFVNEREKLNLSPEASACSPTTAPCSPLAAAISISS
jgi:predicted dehydrogenase